jgi:hypothetical protein
LEASIDNRRLAVARILLRAHPQLAQTPGLEARLLSAFGRTSFEITEGASSARLGGAVIAVPAAAVGAMVLYRWMRR